MDSARNTEAAEAASALVKALWPAVAELTTGQGSGALAALITVARPFLRAELAKVEGIGPQVDRRTAPYHVSAMFWFVSGGNDNAEFLTSTDDQGESCTVYGLQAVLEKLVFWIAELHEGEEVEGAGFHDITSRAATLRTSVTRGGGVGAFRQFYTADGENMLCHAIVRRVSDQDEVED